MCSAWGTAGACDGRLAAGGGLAPRSTGSRSSAVLAWLIAVACSSANAPARPGRRSPGAPAVMPWLAVSARSRPRRRCGCPEGIAADESQQPGLRVGIVGHFDSGPVLTRGPDDLFHLLH